MRFGLTDDHLAFRDAARDLFAKECTPAVVRAAWDAPAGELDRGVWDSLDAMGVLSLLVPEADGGMGLDETFLVPILEEAGRVALPHPLVETAMVAAPLGLSGMVATDLGGPHVACAADADALLLLHDGVLVEVPRGIARLTPLDTGDGGRRAASVALVDAFVEGATDDPAAIALAVDRGTLGTAAFLVGLGQAMLDLTVGYVKERQQFGVAVGSFQAVKHHLADAAPSASNR
jgi:alkylation response protein AidB-like acyl-CoA dehydrogenase